MGEFGGFPVPGQADFLQQRHSRRWAENFQKVWYQQGSLRIPPLQKDKIKKSITNPPLQNDQIEKSISNTPLPKNTPLVKMQIILYNFLNMYILAHIFQSIFLFPNVKCIFAHKRSIYGEV